MPSKALRVSFYLNGYQCRISVTGSQVKTSLRVSLMYSVCRELYKYLWTTLLCLNKQSFYFVFLS